MRRSAWSCQAARHVSQHVPRAAVQAMMMMMMMMMG